MKKEGSSYLGPEKEGGVLIMGLHYKLYRRMGSRLRG